MLKQWSEEHIQLTALRWIDCFFEICADDMLAFVPNLLNQVLPALSSTIPQVRQAGNRVNSSLMSYILSLTDAEENMDSKDGRPTQTSLVSPTVPVPEDDSSTDAKASTATIHGNDHARLSQTSNGTIPPEEQPPVQTELKLDYESSVNAITLQFLNEHEATRISALSWLIMLQRKAPKKVRQYSAF